MELSDAQFERLVALIAESRVSAVTAINGVRVEINEKLEDLKLGQKFIRESVTAIEEDFGKVQRCQREDRTLLMQIEQSVAGLTELASTNFDLLESLNKHIHGESGSIDHGAEASGPRPQ